ncbi:MAG: hypothetical protein H6559_19225 [Lewinellaceae bacterium]|nr:hypothetical protein [Lewinellaceae bacterium]
MEPQEFSQEIEALNDAPFEEVAAFLRSKRFRKSKCHEIFWTSPLPSKWAKQLLVLPNSIDLLFDYFSKPENVNPTFLQEMAKQNHRLLEKAIKISKAYDIQSHWESFEGFRTNQNQQLRIFYKELDYIRKLTSDWQEKAEFYEGVIWGLDYEDILIHTISYFEKFKRSSERTIGKQSLITSTEITLCYTLNNLLTIKQAAIKETGESIKSKYTISAFKKAIQDALPPLNSPEGVIQGKYLPEETISPEKQLIREAIEFYFSFFTVGYQIDRYLCGYADFEFIDELEATLKTNELFLTHWRNDKKSWFQEVLAMNKAAQKEEARTYLSSNKEMYEKQNFLAVHSAIEYWKYLKLPHTITTKEEGEIDFEQVFTLLKAFSNYLMPEGRKIFIPQHDAEERGSSLPYFVAKQNKPEKFGRLFGDGYLYVVEEKKLEKNITEYFGWDTQAVRNLLDFFTIDLSSNTTSEIDFLSRPLLKIGTQYIWLSSLLRDRRWDVLMHRRMAAETLFNQPDQSKEIEMGLADSFKKAGFNAVAGGEYNKGKDDEGEIDTLAFKDNVLFVIELKTTYVEENLLRYAWYHAIKFEYKAIEQLMRHQEYIETNFEAVKSIPELGIDCELEELVIIPLIVSNIFEFDDLLVQGQYRKVSLFELLVILHNDLYESLHNRLASFLSGEEADFLASSVIQSFNQNNPYFKKGTPGQATKEEYSLWVNPEFCSPEDFVNAIKDGKVWKGLDEMMDFRSGESLEIGRFDKGNKWLG